MILLGVVLPEFLRCVATQGEEECREHRNLARLPFLLVYYEVGACARPGHFLIALVEGYDVVDVSCVDTVKPVGCIRTG